MLFRNQSRGGAAFLLIAVVTLLLWGGRGACAQTQYDSFVKDDQGRDIPVIVLRDQAPFHATPGGRLRGRARFMKNYFLLDKKEAGGSMYYLAGIPDELSIDLKPAREVGWFQEQDVLTTLEAQKENGVFLKGLVVTRWDAGGGGREAVVKEAYLRKGPGPGYKSNRKALLYRFYYIFKNIKAAKKDYYLLGGSDTISNSMQPGNTILGWIEGTRLLKWNTRQAIEFDKSTLNQRQGNPAKIYETPREVLQKMESDLVGGKSGSLPEPLAEEDVNTKQWAFDAQRYPLLKTEKNTEHPELGPIMKVGFIGDQIFTDGTGGSYDRKKGEKARQKLAKMLNSLNDLDICFVMDSTGSMRNYFKPAAEAVERIVSHVRTAYRAQTSSGGEAPDIRFSVVFYRDFVDDDGEPDPNDTYLIKRQGYTANDTRIKDVISKEIRTPCDGCGGVNDEPEAVYYAIHQAVIRGAPEVRENAHKVIILIGDKGNHVPDKMGYSSKKIAKILVDNGYEFYPIQVVKNQKIYSDQDCGIFQYQTQQICDWMDKATGGKTRGFNSNDPDQVAAAIVKYAQGAIKLAQDSQTVGKTLLAGEGLKEGFKKVAGGNSAYGLKIQRRMTKLMQKHDIDPEAFIHGGINPFGEGWIAERETKSQARQCKTMLLLERSNLNLLISILVNMNKSGIDQHRLLRMWTTVVKENLGEVNVKKKVGDLLNVHLGIPVRMNLLKHSFGEILAMPKLQLKSEMRLLHTKLRLLNCLSTERKCVVRDGQVEDIGEKKIWWDLPEQISAGRGEGKYGWIAADEMP